MYLHDVQVWLTTFSGTKATDTSRSSQVRINHMAHWADARGPAGGRGPAAAGPAMLHACIVIGLTICTTWSENTNRKLSE
jgi:hypothetical protein